MCLAAGYVTFTVGFNSSAYLSGVREIARDLGGKVIGRQYVLLPSLFLHVAANVATCFCQDLITLFVLRFLSGAFGAAPLTGSAAVITDIFPPLERGLAITVYALVPLISPVLGPIVGEYVVATLGWRWLMGVMALISASALLAALLLLPETYALVLLRKRAQRISNMTGWICESVMDAGKHGRNATWSTSWTKTLLRPFSLVAHEPIVTILALYQAVVFGTLYLTIAAFPMVYTDFRGWPQENSGLSFVGVLVGVLLAVVFQIWDYHRYFRLGNEAVLPEAHIHWLINTAAGIPFGFGIILVTIGSTNYLVDSYAIFAASVVAVYEFLKLRNQAITERSPLLSEQNGV
ncbi:hypothetical protein VTG60DRAFT_680 [Thermothelomyces hinnuleus]